MKGPKAQIVRLFLAIYLWLLSATSFAAVNFDNYFNDLKAAAESGDFSPYLGLSYTRNPRVKNIEFNPDKLDGAKVTLHLLFDDKSSLVAFSLNDGKAVELNTEEKALFSIYKDHSELIREFFKSPTPQLRKEFAKVIEPVVDQVTDKVDNELKTNLGKFVYNSSQDLGELSKKAAGGLAMSTLVTTQFVLRLLDSINMVVLGAYIVVQTVGYPIYGVLLGIPSSDLVSGLKYLAVGVVSTLAIRKTISLLLRWGIKVTGKQILEMKRANNQSTDGVDLSQIDDKIDRVDTGGACNTRLGAVMKFIFR